MQYVLKIVRKIEDLDYFTVIDVEIDGHRHRVLLKYDIKKLEETNYVKAPLMLNREIKLDLNIAVYKARRVLQRIKALPDSTWPYGLCKGIVRKAETYWGEYALLPYERVFKAISYKAQIDCGTLTLDADLRMTRVRVGNWVNIDGTLVARGIEEANQETLVEASHNVYQEGESAK